MLDSFKNSVSRLQMAALIGALLLTAITTNSAVTQSATGAFSEITNLNSEAAPQPETSTEEADPFNLQQGLQGYWRFDNPEVSRGYSLEFDGEDDYVRTSFNSYNISPISVSAWAKFDSVGDGDYDYIIGSSGEFGLRQTKNADDIQLLTYNGSSHSTSVSGIKEDRWYHVAGVFNGSAYKVYLNGELGSLSLDSVYTPGENNESIGAMGDSRFMDGEIDNVRVYNRSLSPSEVQSLYRESPVSREGLVLYQDFNEGPSNCDLTSSTACLEDESGKSNDGIPQGFDDNQFDTGSGWLNETPLNSPSLKDYSRNSKKGVILGLKTAELDKGGVDGLEGDYNLLENPGFEDTSLGTGVNVNASGWDMDHQDLYLNGDSIFDLQSSKATEGSYGYGEESCCDPYDDGSGDGGAGSGYIAQRENIGEGQEIHASIKANIFVRGLSNVGSCPGSDVYVGEDDSRLRFVAYNSTGHQIGSKWGNWGSWFVYQAGNTSGDYNGWTKLKLDWTTPSETDEVEMRVYYGDATDSCQPWTWWDGGNGAVYWDEARFVREESLKWIEGPSGDHALKFDKEDDILKNIDNSELVREYNKDREITINLWLRIDRIYTDSRWNDIIQFGDTTDGTNIGGDGVRLERLSSTNDTLAFYTYNEGGNNQWNLGTAGPYQKGTWHMATLVMDYPENSESRVYLDGELSDTTSQPETWNMRPGTLEIFSQGNWADFAIDDLRFYDRALSQDEIKSLYNGEKVRKGLLSQWNFESGDRETAYDTSSLDKKGILGTTSFDTSDGRMEIKPNIDLSDSASVSVWTEPQYEKDVPEFFIIHPDTTEAFHYYLSYGNGSFSEGTQFGGNYAGEDDGGIAVSQFSGGPKWDMVNFNTTADEWYLWEDIGDEAPEAPKCTVYSGDYSSKSQGVDAGDINADGRMDIISAQHDIWLENTGNCNWKQHDLGIDTYRDIELGDFNENGCLDAIVGNNNVNFRKGYCNGSFGPPEVISKSSPNDDNWLGSGDFNEDGHLDLIWNSQGKGEIYIYAGDGEGNFDRVNVIDDEDYSHVNTGSWDFNNDGHMDFIAGEHGDGDIDYFMGQGDGTFIKSPNGKIDTQHGALGVGVYSPRAALGGSETPSLAGTGNFKLDLNNYRIAGIGGNNKVVSYRKISGWDKLTLVSDSDSNELRIYLGGKLLKSEEISDFIYTENFSIGRMYKGKLDEVRIYNRSLSEREIKRLAFR